MTEHSTQGSKEPGAGSSGQTVAFAIAAVVAAAVGLGIIMLADSRQVPAAAGDPSSQDADAPTNKASPADEDAKATPRVRWLIFKHTPVGAVLLERPDHGGRSRPRLTTSDVPLSLSFKLTNDGAQPFTHLSLLSVGPLGAVTFVGGGEQGSSSHSAPAPVGAELPGPAAFSVGPLAGRYHLIALLSRRPLQDADLATPLAQLRLSTEAGRVRVPPFATPTGGPDEIVELRQELDLVAAPAP